MGGGKDVMKITAELFETWFPDKPEIILMDFLKSTNDDMFMVIPIKGDKENKIIAHVTRESAVDLLNQFITMRRIK